MPTVATPGKLVFNGVATSTVVSLIMIAAAVLVGWWRIEAQIDQQIDQKQAPLERKVDEIQKEVKEIRGDIRKVDRQQGHISGQLESIQDSLNK